MWTQTKHVWTCKKGHEFSISDQGHPARPGVKEAVLAAWNRHGEKCVECGSPTTFRPEESEVP